MTRTEELRAHRLLQRLPAVAWDRDARTGRFIYVNEAAEKLLGFPLAEWTEHPDFWATHIHEADRARVVRRFTRFRERGGAYDTEYRMRTASDGEVWVRDVAAFAIAHVRPTHICGILQDITAYKVAFDAHVAQEERLRRQNGALMALATRDAAGEDPVSALRAVTEADARALAVTRVSVWHIQPDGIRCLDLFDSVAGTHERGALLSLADSGTYSEALRDVRALSSPDARHDPRLRDLRDYLVHHGITSMLDAPVRVNGRIVGVICHEQVGTARLWTVDEQQFAASMADLVALAISARTSKTALRVSEARAEAVLQASPDAMVVLDRKGCVVRFNAAAEAFFGRPRVEVLRGDFADLFVPEAERESVRAALRGALEGGDEVPDLRLELRVVGATGEIPAELRAFAFPQEEQVLLAAFVRSVRGAAGEDRAEFERLFEARAAPLREALLEMESYAAAVAHELRGPIRVLDAYSQLLSEEMGRDLHPDGQRFLARMRAAVARMADLVRDVMLLARVSSVDLHRERVDLGTVAEAIAAELREQAPERRVTFDIAAPEPAFCDPGLVRLLLDNLLRNAWKFTSGHPTARICFRSLRAGDERAWCVEDDGAGFDPAQIAELFLPFRRLHGASQFEGTGIGLVTARRIVERHGGRVWAEGAVERGARFCFTLPERGEEPRRPT